MPNPPHHTVKILHRRKPQRPLPKLPRLHHLRRQHNFATGLTKQQRLPHSNLLRRLHQHPPQSRLLPRHVILSDAVTFVILSEAKNPRIFFCLIRHLLRQQHLNHPARPRRTRLRPQPRPHRKQPRRQHPRVVQHQQVSRLQMLR